ncbi:MAG: DNA polymerase III subunit beta [Agarilytica sp.]
MRFSVSREALLKPLQLVTGVVERRQTLPVLANVLLVLENNQLSLTGTDLEVEIVGRLSLEGECLEGEITVPAKKLLDICKSLPEGSVVEFSQDEQKAVVKSGRSRFSLSTLPANDFPAVEEGNKDLSFTCPQKSLKELIEKTSFAMAQQDVRYYLNGMLWEIRPQEMRVVTTDGHRLAMCTKDIGAEVSEVRQSIIPRKGVIELSRLLEENDDDVEIIMGASHVRAITEGFTFTSKLVDGKFPDYERVLPKGGDKLVIGDRAELKSAFARTSILSNEKYRGVRLLLETGTLTVVANNPEQEEAEDQVAVDYTGDSLEVGFNVSYLQDVANVINTDNLKITLSDSNSSALIEAPEGSDAVYVVMPMRL